VHDRDDSAAAPGTRSHRSPWPFPGGRTLCLPDALVGRFGVVLYYRGSWCPYCNAQLSAFQRSLDSLADVDTSVVAPSVDDEATTLDLIARHGLRFPVGHSADAAARYCLTPRNSPSR
jgi:peroxiredoxin